MDIFGIEQAMKGMALTYFQSSRRTGRTVAMIESLKDGDCVCFADHREAKRVRTMCKERGFDIETEVIDPRNPGRIFDGGSKKGRYLFDHSWVERYYMNAIEKASLDISHFQEQKSGFGEAHLETRRRAAELKKWNLPW